MQKDKIGWLVFAVLWFSFDARPVEAKFRRAGEPRVSFFAQGPAGMKIDGVTHELRLEDDGQKLTIEIPLSKFKTGIDLRDKHLREKYLEVAKYPTAKLVVPWSSIHMTPQGASGKSEGPLTLHGKTKTTRFAYTVKPRGKTFHVVGELRVNINDFGIQVPNYLGVTVQPLVNVKVEFDAAQ